MADVRVAARSRPGPSRPRRIALVHAQARHFYGSERVMLDALEALRDSGRDVQILQRMHQAADHPVSITFPEGNYLKGLICHVP